MWLGLGKGNSYRRYVMLYVAMRSRLRIISWLCVSFSGAASCVAWACALTGVAVRRPWPWG